ncbi:kinase-like domain-containing protein [Phyllosticta citriasiana]|uniref:Kinase-like domain-containing protein n=1 Tax=Phyllosticta citriasiana TaxID=595635 RepID=A0ABR1KBF2_9PEZI
MDHDDIAEGNFEIESYDYGYHLAEHKKWIYEEVGKIRGSSDPAVCTGIMGGSFNFALKLDFVDGGPPWLIRFPLLGRVMFPDEKTLNEIAVMEYLREKTSLPVPEVVAYSLTKDTPQGVGPFIITTFFEGGTRLIDRMRKEAADRKAGLDLDLSEEILEKSYRVMAKITLELSRCTFDRVGSIERDGDEGNSEWKIGERAAITHCINETMRCCGVRPERILEGSFTVDQYFTALLDEHMHQLQTQRNAAEIIRKKEGSEDDMEMCAEDFRKKFLARHFFRNTILPKFPASPDLPAAALFCDDLSPGNVLVDDDFNIVAAIDWEFSYAAPYQYTCSPPHWLLINNPGDWMWEHGITNFLDTYRPRFETFLKILRQLEEEDKAKDDTADSVSKSDQSSNRPRLSTLMQQSWDDGTFWLVEAVKRSGDIDQVYWDCLDERFHGNRVSALKREKLLDEETRREMELLVEKKLEDLRLYNAELEVFQKKKKEYEERVERDTEAEAENRKGQEHVESKIEDKDGEEIIEVNRQEVKDEKDA